MRYLLGVVLILTSLQPGAAEPKAETTKEQEAAYEKAVQKCNAKSGAAKQECIESAKEKHGEMLK